MGCCVTRIGVLNEFPYQEIEEFNKLKIEIVQILNSKEDMNYEDNNQILELINKINIKIARSEELLDNLKIKKRNKSQTIKELIQGIKTDIKDLEEYNKFLNSQIKKNKNEINLKTTLKSKQIEIITEENTLNNKDDDDIKDNNIKLKSKKELNGKPIYYKKAIIKSKYNEIFNKSKKYTKTENCSNSIIYNRNKGNIINNNFAKNKTSISTINEDKNKININIILENGNKITKIADVKDKFIDIINKLGEEYDEYNNIENIIILNGDDDITNKVKNGEIISDFEFKDNYNIKIKFKENKKVQ